MARPRARRDRGAASDGGARRACRPRGRRGVPALRRPPAGRPAQVPASDRGRALERAHEDAEPPRDRRPQRDRVRAVCARRGRDRLRAERRVAPRE